MVDFSDFLGIRRLSALVESRHSISSGNGKALYRVKLLSITDENSGTCLWRQKTVSDGKKWTDVETGARVFFDARLDFDLNNKLQIYSVKNVEVAPSDGSPWWQLW